MDIKELKLKKRECEEKISNIIAEIMEKFQQETGIMITEVSVNIDLLRNMDKEIVTSICDVNICMDI